MQEPQQLPRELPILRFDGAAEESESVFVGLVELLKAVEDEEIGAGGAEAIGLEAGL